MILAGDGTCLAERRGDTHHRLMERVGTQAAGLLERIVNYHTEAYDQVHESNDRNRTQFPWGIGPAGSPNGRMDCRYAAQQRAGNGKLPDADRQHVTENSKTLRNRP